MKEFLSIAVGTAALITLCLLIIDSTGRHKRRGGRIPYDPQRHHIDQAALYSELEDYETMGVTFPDSGYGQQN